MLSLVRTDKVAKHPSNLPRLCAPSRPERICVRATHPNFDSQECRSRDPLTHGTSNFCSVIGRDLARVDPRISGSTASA